MKIASYVGLFAGLAAMVGLLVWQGLGQILGLLASSGWSLLLVPVIWAPCLLPAALSWRLLFLPGRAPKFARALHALWIGRAVNTLLPVATIGGEAVKARLVHFWGVAGSDATASVVVDKSVQVLALILWGATGVACLAEVAIETPVLVPVVVGLVVLSAGVAGFVVVQRAGMLGFLTRLAGHFVGGEGMRRLEQGATTADAVVADLYRRPARVCGAVALKFAGLVVQASEVWLAAHLLGFPVTLIEAVMLKSLTSTLSDVAFVVPNAYGVQEGGFVLFGAVLGLPPDTALAVSLATRIRELAIDVPALFAWHHIEGKRLIWGT